jgi:hypothetical protein
LAYVTLRPAALLEERPFDAPERRARQDPRAEDDDAQPAASRHTAPPAATLPVRPRTSPSSTAYSSVYPVGPAKKGEAVQPQRIQVAAASQRADRTRPVTGTQSPPDTAPASVRRTSHDRYAEATTDRRAAPRARYATLVRLLVSDDRRLEGRTVTISRTGASVLLLESLPEGTAAVARFALPSSEATVSLPCTIVRESEHHDGGHLLGLRFGRVPFEVEQEIQRFVEAAATAASVPPPLREG